MAKKKYIFSRSFCWTFLTFDYSRLKKADTKRKTLKKMFRLSFKKVLYEIFSIDTERDFYDAIIYQVFRYVNKLGTMTIFSLFLLQYETKKVKLKAFKT